MNKDYYVERKNSDSRKWDLKLKELGRDDLIPMWVADMDFMVDENISEHLKNIIDRKVYGYSYTDDSYYEAMIDFNKQRHGIVYQKDWILFAHGAVSAIYEVINCFSDIDDAIMILTPVYPQFKKAIINTKRKVSDVELVNDDGHFRMDLKKIEEAIVKDEVKILIFCNPHNPTGRVWQKVELEALLEICHKHGVLMLSDEVHQDLIFKGYKHTPMLDVSSKYDDMIITINACAKTFNLAMFPHAHIIIKDEKLRQELTEYKTLIHTLDPDYIAMQAVKTAYKHGQAWLDDILEIIEENYRMLSKTLDDLNVAYSKLEGTYLIFVDMHDISKGLDIAEFVYDHLGIVPNFGADFKDTYHDWIRINLATDPKHIQMLIDNLKKACRMSS